jgi:hypothetical protein
MPQLDLFGGKKKRRFRFGPAFKRAGKHDSPAEAKIALWLDRNGISHRAHQRIVPARLAKKGVFSEEEKAELVKGAPEAVLAKVDLARVRPELFRTDFVVEGAGRKIFIEYFGLWNPKAKTDKKSLRQRHARQVAIYTFVKFPLKKRLYEKSGAETIFIFPGELGKLDEKLAPLKGIDQRKGTLNGLSE